MERLSLMLLILSLGALFFTTSHAQDTDIDTLRASDVNADGVVNILDLVLVAQHFGETPTEKQDPNPDVNGDGTVNILDLVLVAQHFGRSIDLEPQPPPAVLIAAAPPNNSHIAPQARIDLIFDNAPADVVASSGTVTVISKKTVRVSGPFTLSPPALTITWGDGTQTLSYTVIGKDTDPPKVTGGTVSAGETVDADVINNDGKIEIIFSEKVTGNIALQTEDGDDVGWLGEVKDTQGTLRRIRGKELGHATRYVIKSAVSDSAGNVTYISIAFVTNIISFTPPENLIDHWWFDEVVGNIATNSIRSHDGGIFGAKWANGVAGGNALEFDGVDNAVVVKDYPTFDITENMTFTAWFRPTIP